MSLCWKEHKVGRGKRDILIIGVFGRSLFYKHYHYVDNSESICSTRLLLLSGMGGWNMDAVCFIAYILFWGHKQTQLLWLPANSGGKKNFFTLVSHHYLDNINQGEKSTWEAWLCWSWQPQDHRLMDGIGFEGTLKPILFHPPAIDTFHLNRFLQVSFHPRRMNSTERFSGFCTIPLRYMTLPHQGQLCATLTETSCSSTQRPTDSISQILCYRNEWREKDIHLPVVKRGRYFESTHKNTLKLLK